jgi:transposase
MKRLLTLTDEEREQISRRYKQEKNPRYRERLQCLLFKDRGLTNLEVAALLQVVPETITDWLNLYQDGGVEALCRLVTGGSDSFLSEEQILLLTAELDQLVFQSAKQVCAWVQQEFDISYSERGMRDLLKRLGYTRQKAHLVPAQADFEAQAAFLKGV